MRFEDAALVVQAGGGEVPAVVMWSRQVVPAVVMRSRQVVKTVQSSCMCVCSAATSPRQSPRIATTAST